MKRESIKPETSKMSQMCGHIVATPEESMYDRISEYKRQHPTHVIKVDAHLPYSAFNTDSQKGSFPVTLMNAPSLGQIVIHKAIVINENDLVISTASVVQHHHSLYDFPSRAISDAIWYTGESKGPRHTFEEILWEDQLVEPVERMRRKKKSVSIKAKMKQLGEKYFNTESSRWFDPLDERDREWIINNAINDLSVHCHSDAYHNEIPEVLRRVGICGELKIYTIGDKSIEVVEAFESKKAPLGILGRNCELLRDAGFEYNLDQKSKKWAYRIGALQKQQVA